MTTLSDLFLKICLVFFQTDPALDAMPNPMSEDETSNPEILSTSEQSAVKLRYDHYAR